jgi:hypothetical protein
MLLEKPGDTELKRPEAWISNMLELEQQNRYNAQTLLELIQESCQGPDARYPFIGICCTDYDDSAESVQSSVFEPNLVEYTTAATTISTEFSKEVAGVSAEGTPAECADDKTLSPTPMTKSIATASSAVNIESDADIEAESSTQRWGGQGPVIGTLPVNTDMRSLESDSTSANVLSKDLAEEMINLERGVCDLQAKLSSGEKIDGSSSPCSKSQVSKPLTKGKKIAPSTMQVPTGHITVVPSGQATSDNPDEGTDHSSPTLGSITPEERKLYNETFLYTASPGRSVLTGDQARSIFDQSGLPTDELAKIWLLSDPNCRGSLNSTEFCVALHLIHCKVNNTPIPDSLPYILEVELHRSIPLCSTAPMLKPAESVVPDNREVAPLTRYANRQPTLKTEPPYPDHDTVSTLASMVKAREKEKKVRGLIQENTHEQDILGPDGLQATHTSPLPMRTARMTAVGPTALIQIFATIWDAHGSGHVREELYSLPYHDLHESVFFDKLCSRIDITAEQAVVLERHSFSAGVWVMLDPNNQEGWKSMYRAAEASLELRIRATILLE